MPMLREIRWAYLTSAYSRSKKKIYVFDSSGVLGKGWTVYGSRKYYANAKGEITRGFKTIDGKTYFFNDYGSMHTGWLYYNGKYYYLNPSDGVMVTGTKNIGGTSYTFSDSGISSRALEGNWTVKSKPTAKCSYCLQRQYSGACHDMLNRSEQRNSARYIHDPG